MVKMTQHHRHFKGRAGKFDGEKHRALGRQHVGRGYLGTEVAVCWPQRWLWGEPVVSLGAEARDPEGAGP